MESRLVYYTPPAKSYRVLYSTSSSGMSGVGYGPSIEGMRGIVEKWVSEYGDSASWAIQEGFDGNWSTIDNRGYFDSARSVPSLV